MKWPCYANVLVAKPIFLFENTVSVLTISTFYEYLYKRVLKRIYLEISMILAPKVIDFGVQFT